MIVNPALEQYMADLLPARDPLLAEMEAYAYANKINIIGPGCASILAQLVLLSGARRIFELGSAIGYSTIWLARAAGPGAEIHYSDGDPANASRARDYFTRAGLADRITVHTGDALTALASTTGEFDMIFNDVDKEGYPDVLDVAPDRVRPGGVFVTDNTLWKAKVLDPQDDETEGVDTFNRRLFADPRFLTSLIPLRDGMTLGIKLRRQ
ncbi:MAG: O-methyltransferase [Bryobacterales bacterium]|nr:O-methyltransferase [Bryobacterales bacterium]